MKQFKLEDHVKDILGFHFGWDLWAIYPERSFEEVIKDFVHDIVRLVSSKPLPAIPQYTHCFPKDVEDEDWSDLTKVIGRKLKRLRRNNGWSLEYMAEATGLDLDYYDHMEQGASWLQVWELSHVLGEFGVSISSFLKGIEQAVLS
jgi:Helix-turn-helix domain